MTAAASIVIYNGLLVVLFVANLNQPQQSTGFFRKDNMA